MNLLMKAFKKETMTKLAALPWTSIPAKTPVLRSTLKTWWKVTSNQSQLEVRKEAHSTL